VRGPMDARRLRLALGFLWHALHTFLRPCSSARMGRAVDPKRCCRALRFAGGAGAASRGSVEHRRPVRCPCCQDNCRGSSSLADAAGAAGGCQRDSAQTRWLQVHPSSPSQSHVQSLPRLVLGILLPVSCLVRPRSLLLTPGSRPHKIRTSLPSRVCPTLGVQLVGALRDCTWPGPLRGTSQWPQTPSTSYPLSNSLTTRRTRTRRVSDPALLPASTREQPSPSLGDMGC